MTFENFLESARRTIKLEMDAVAQLLNQLDDEFTKACELAMRSEGRLIVSGMGKSGHIGRKIAATLASTGTPAFFVHPGEASHGDLGMITRQDVVLALSNSGESSEIISIIPAIKRVGAPLIAITGNPESSLGSEADATLNSSVEVEACPLNLAPTSSTTVQLILGDALAIALLEAKGFSEEDFAISHPGGSLGKRLLLKVKDLMHTGTELPIVRDNTPLKDALLEITQKKLGLAIIVNQQDQFAGLFTDGDLRRAIENHSNPLALPVSDVMHAGGTTIESEQLAAEALYIMEQKKITALVIINTDQSPKGVIHLHDLVQAGMA